MNEPSGMVEQLLLGIWRDVLRTPDVGVNESFFDRGGTSMAAVQVLLRVQEQFNLEVPVRQLLETPTVSGFARAMYSANAAAVQEEIDLAQEVEDESAQLPRAEGPPRTGDPTCFLLTGATGFVGSFVLHALLQDGHSLVRCLVRCDDADEGRARLEKVLHRYGLAGAVDLRRVAVIPGNLEEPALGLDEGTWCALAQEVDAVIHAASAVNFVLPYGRLKDGNVLGTGELIRLAAQSRTKPLHHVSTVDVLAAGEPSDGRLLESDALLGWQRLTDGYARSKWVAEGLLRRAAALGVPVTVYRPAVISGSLATGKANGDDLVSRMIRACLELGLAPELKGALNLVPVDMVARSIVHIARNRPHDGFRALHVVNRTPLEIERLYGMMQERGFPLDVVPYSQWRERVVAAAMQSPETHPLFPLLPLFLTGGAMEGGVGLGEEASIDDGELRALLEGTPHACPPPDVRMVAPYLAGLRRRPA